MKKLSSFAEFSETKRINAAAALKEEQEIKRSGEANSFKSLLTEFGVSGIKELSEEQRSDFFNKLRNLGVNESNSLITEGTRSQVGVISKSGKITSTYVHSDGYPEHMLPMLNGYSESDIKQLMKLGKAGISFLDKSIGKKHSFSEPTKGYTIFYGRDRGESGDMRTTGQYRKVDQYLNDVANGTGAEWVYLWDEEHKNWLVADLYGDKELMPSSTFESVVTEYNYFGGNKISDDKLVRLIPKMPKGYVGKNTGIGKYTITTPEGEDIVLTHSKDKKNWFYEPSNAALKILDESVVTEYENTIGGLNKMANTDLERIADYADMIKDRMSQGQQLDAWMYSKISDSVKNLNSVHDTMDGNDGVIESNVDEANKGKVHRAAKKGSYPAVIVAVQDGKVIHQEPVSTPEVAPATFNVMQEKYPKALLHLEDNTGKRLFSESVVNEAKFVKDFDKAVLKATTKEEVLELYPNAEFFIGKSDHFFGELDTNLFFKAYYTKGQKEFKISSVYSEKNKNYVHLYNESVISEAVNANAYIKAGKLGYNDQFLAKRSLSWTLSVDLGLKAADEFVGPWLGFDHVSLYVNGKKGGTILDDALTGKYTYDELKAAAAKFLGIK